MIDTRLYVTIDVDWSHDDVTSRALDVFRSLNVPVTVFLTHDSPFARTIMIDEDLEPGIHPNLNALLTGTDDEFESAEARVQSLQEQFPAARCVRSHSLTQSTRLLDLFARLGFTHEVNTFIPAACASAPLPWRHWSGRLVRVPYIFDDSLASAIPGGWDDEAILAHPGPRVVNFHPGRLFLNWRETTMPAEVMAARQDPEQYAAFARPDALPGSREFARRLVERHRGQGGAFGVISEIEPAPLPEIIHRD